MSVTRKYYHVYVEFASKGSKTTFCTFHRDEAEDYLKKQVSAFKRIKKKTPNGFMKLQILKRIGFLFVGLPEHYEQTFVEFPVDKILCFTMCEY